VSGLQRPVLEWILERKAMSVANPTPLEIAQVWQRNLRNTAWKAGEPAMLSPQGAIKVCTELINVTAENVNLAARVKELEDELAAIRGKAGPGRPKRDAVQVP
jgi:hypothetical protein